MLKSLATRPARITALSFVVASVLGAILLSLPAARVLGVKVSFLDQLFTAVSAVCVTGLTVSDISATYTVFGQLVLLVLMQIGGTGIMVVSSAVVIASGQQLGLRSRAALAATVDAPSVSRLRRTVYRILVLTVLVELIGTAGLLLLFSGRPEIEAPVFTAVFHAVSAFCNAGFTNLPHGLAPYAGSAAISLAVAALITIGGLGFPVLDEVVQRVRSRLRGERPARFSLHSRMVLGTSAALTVIAAVLLLVLIEPVDPSSSLPARGVVALFHAVTARTAGFSTIDVGALSPAALMVLAVFMFIGASPGSTGGGIKTTTFAVLMTTFRWEVSGQRHPEVLNRRLSALVVRRAIAVVFVSSSVVTVLVFVLLLTETGAPEALAFEAVSAFGTVGLSTGVTQDLSAVGKVAVILTMLIGRIGPLTVALALAEDREPAHRELPEEEVLIG